MKRALLFLSLLVTYSSLIMGQTELAYELNFSADAVKKFDKAELGIKLPSEIQTEVNEFLKDDSKGLNPFDPEAIDLTSTWTSPSGKTQKVNGFYYQNFRRKNDNSWTEAPSPYLWLLRWSPDEVGDWEIKITLNSKGKTWTSESIIFTCIASESKGYLTINPFKPNGNKYLYQVDSDEPFFTIGHNIAHGGFGTYTPKHCENHRTMIQQIADGKGNFTRIELGMENYLPSGKDCKNYSTMLNRMGELDQLVGLCDAIEVYFIAFRHHTEMASGPSWSKSVWSLNGFNTSLNLANRKAYYTDKEAIRWQKNELRYIMARWGYSPSFAFYGYSEIEGWVEHLATEENITQVEAMKIFNLWWMDQRNFIENELGIKKMLYANSFAGNAIPKAVAKMKPTERGLYDIFLQSDIVPFHQYGNGKGTMLDHRIIYQNFHTDRWDKPMLLEECGFATGHFYCATDQDFFTAMWTTAFYNGMGIGMDYWSIRGVNDMGFCALYEPLANFNELIDRKSVSSSGYGYNKSENKSRLAQFHLLSEEKNTVYGFLYDPAYYWRNMRAENKKINELISDGRTKEECQTIDDYGIGVPLSNENPNFDGKRYHDAYTEQADKAPLTAQNYGSQTISIKGLEKSGVFGKKMSYVISYYDPRDPNLKILKTETVQASRNGKIQLTLDESVWPACAFIIRPST